MIQGAQSIRNLTLSQNSLAYTIFQYVLHIYTILARTRTLAINTSVLAMSTNLITSQSASSHGLCEVLYGKLPSHVSPGLGLQATRLAAPSADAIFIAGGQQLLLVQPIPPVAASFRRGSQGPSVSAPETFAALFHFPLLAPSTHAAEIQSVAALAQSDGSFLVGTSDSSGKGVLSFVSIHRTFQASEQTSPHPNNIEQPDSLLKPHVTMSVPCPVNRSSPDTDITMVDAKAQPSENNGRPSPHRVELRAVESYALLPAQPVEAGWSGIALSPQDSRFSAVTTAFGRCITVFNEDKPLRRMATPLNPTQLQYFSLPNANEPVIALTESNVLSIWDVRVAEKSGCVQRLQPSTASLYALDGHSASGQLAVGGEEKAVYVFDSKKWTPSGQWKKVMKYEIFSLRFSSANPKLCYAVGLDHEVICGSWCTQKVRHESSDDGGKGEGFRGDSRWIGFDQIQVAQSDHLFGLTETGHFYVLRHPWRMFSDRI